MKKTFLLSFNVFFFTIAFAQESSYFVEAGKSTYNEQSLNLSAKVNLRSDNAKMQAQEAKLSKSSDQSFSRLEAKGNIFLQLEQSLLYCDLASIDLKKLEANFSAIEGKLVHFKDLSLEEELKMNCQHINVQVEKEQNKYKLAKLIAQKEVSIDYATLQSFSDQAIIHRISPEPDGLLLLLSPKAEGGQCSLQSEGQDSLTGARIKLDLSKKLLHCLEAKGKFNLPNGDAAHFKAKNLQWNKEKQELLLKKEAEIDLNSKGKIYSEKSILVKKQGDVHELLALGKSKVELLLPNKGLAKVSTEEKVLFKDGQYLSFFSGSSKQVHYQDPHSDFYADQIFVKFQDKLSFKLDELKLKGHLRMKNTRPVNTEEEGEIEQYILADEASFLNDSQKIVFSSTLPKRVLFLDKVKNIQLSAAEIEISRKDIEGAFDSVKGKGDVRLRLNEEEYDIFHKEFQL